MKKIILLITLQLTVLFSGSFVMKPGQPLIKSEEETTSTIQQEDNTTTPLENSSIHVLRYTETEHALPSTPIDITNQTVMGSYGLTALVADGVNDDSARLKTIAKNTNVTNWYIPSGKTILIKSIAIPAHIDAIFGGGIIKVKANTSPNGSSSGAFNFPNALDGIVIDGLYFIGENKPYPGTQEDKHNGVIYPDHWAYMDHSYTGPSGNVWRHNGHITMDGFTSKNDIEIRNCTFDMSNFKYNGIKGYGNKAGGGGGKLTNLKIHNNKFKNYGEFGIEIIDLERVADGSGHNVTGLRIYNNDLTNNGGMALSLVLLRAGEGNTGLADGTENRVYNNIIDGASWGLEYSGCSGLYVYNNKFTNIYGKMFLAGQGWLITAMGKNFIFDNHLTESYKDYGTQWSVNTNDEYYGNYISGHIIVNDSLNKFHEYFGHWHDNTIVLNDSANSWNETMLIKDRHIGTIENNDFYGASNVSRGLNLTNGAGSSQAFIQNNNFYMQKATGICLDNAETSNVVGNNCIQGHTGAIPTSRNGAGLSDPSIVGVQY